MKELLVATNNAGKQQEFRRLLASLPVRLVTPSDLGLDLTPDEPHETYAENARAKAEAFCRQTGLVSLADDAGIEVASLGWGPGVHTARYGDAEDRNPVDVVLDRLAGVSDRRARMVCWLAVAVPSPSGDPHVELFDGTVEGSIAERPRGDGGFGFDPIFELPEGVTTAELRPEDKDRRSHRGRAVAAALPRLAALAAVDTPPSRKDP